MQLPTKGKKTSGRGGSITRTTRAPKREGRTNGDRHDSRHSKYDNSTSLFHQSHMCVLCPSDVHHKNLTWMDKQTCQS